MKNPIIKTAVAILVMMTVTSMSAPCRAESVMKDVATNGIYGGIAGTLIGAALLAFTDKPGDHLDYLGYGAAVGTVGGVAVGVYEVGHALAEVENGKVQFAFPTIVPDVGETNSKGQTPVAVVAQLFKAKF